MRILQKMKTFIKKLWRFLVRSLLLLIILYFVALFTDARILTSENHRYVTSGGTAMILECVYWRAKPFWVPGIGLPEIYPMVELISEIFDTEMRRNFWDGVCPNFYFQPNPLASGTAMNPLN